MDATPASRTGRGPCALLFVCWGNICRSPTAEAVMRRMVEDAGLAGLVEVDSAGTSAEHQGDRPTAGAIAEADRRGLDLRSQRAQGPARRLGRLRPAAGGRRRGRAALLRQAPPGADLAKVRRMTAFGPDAGTIDEVPDPYYGGPDGFEHVYEVVSRACAGPARPRAGGERPG